jgi:superfamily II DNA/RNA helicase
VLVATDVAARGVHVDDVELVVHVDPPTEHKAYLHRSGRTARAGSEGDVVTLVLPAQEKDLAQLMRKAGIQAATQRVTHTSDAVTTLVGDVAEYVKPAPRSAPTPRGTGGGRSQGANAQRKRAARDGQSQPARSAQPRRDRSGRPARSGGSSTSGGSRPMYTSSSHSAPSGNPRREGRRAQG